MSEISDEFVKAAIEDPAAAKAMLKAIPEAAEGYWAALVMGDVRAVEELVAANSALAVEPGGPEQVAPLVYVCFSRLRMGDVAGTARVLLRHGASPDSTCIADGFPDNPLSCLYAATGRSNNPVLARVLLEAGANPNDGESLYHAAEHPDLTCVRLLLEFGAKVEGSNALKHVLDREDAAAVNVLLGAGADPNERNEQGETSLHWAVRRQRSPTILRILASGGADLDARAGDGRTAYSMAVLRGDSKAAAALAELGALTELSPLERLVAGQPVELESVTWGPGDERLVPDLADTHSTDAVRRLLDAGLPVNAPGQAGATALHWASWRGFADLAALLVSRGASLEALDAEFGGTPAGWMEHGLENCPERMFGDYDGVARALGIIGGREKGVE